MLMDLASVRIAEAYYQDMYLKHLSVPHFKMPEVTVEMPVAIVQVNSPGSNVTNSKLLTEIKKRVTSDLGNLMPRVLVTIQDSATPVKTMTLRSLPTRAATLSSLKGAELSARTKTTSKTIVDIVFKNASPNTDGYNMPIRLTRLADDLELSLSRELTTNYRDYFVDNKGNLDQQAVDGVLRLARESFFDSVTSIMEKEETTVEIIGNTSALIGTSDTKYMTVVKMTLREQDFEWKLGEKDDNGIEERHLTIE